MSFEQIYYLIILIVSLLAIILTFGVVLRVERKLDISYKFILIAVIFFSVGIFLDLFRSYQIIIFEDYDFLIKGLFLIFFTLGVYKMRALIKEINEEVIKKEQEK